MVDHLEDVKSAIIEGKHKEIEGLVRAAVDGGTPLEDIINSGMIAAMDVVGERFSEGRIFVPEMLVSAVTMKKGLDMIKPRLKETQSQSKGTVLMCTVKGDIHDIGKNLVIMMLEGAGFEVIDMGVDMSVETLIDKVEKEKPAILGLSALLTTTMPEMEKAINALEAKGLRDAVKVMVGGAPLDKAFAERIGADGYGKDAAAAVQLARGFVRGT
jgi:corrinoid protein of di/trimethylamine methyltransferase